MTRLQLMRRIILPQAARIAAPTLLNYFIDMIKSTSLAFTLGVTEMMGAAQKEAAGSFRYFEAFLVVAILYWIIVEALSLRAAAGWRCGCTGPSRDDPGRGADQALRRPRRCSTASTSRSRTGERIVDHRPLGHRQVDAAALPELPRPARRRPDHPRRPHASTPRTPAARDILALRRRTAFVFQNYALFANKTARENITEALVTVQRQPPAEARRPRRRGARRDRARRPRRRLSGGALGRPAAAHRHRPGDGARRRADAGRRADLGARPRVGRRGARPAAPGRRRSTRPC